jgi:hypothetical protein
VKQKAATRSVTADCDMLLLLRGKGYVAAVPGADTVGSYNSKMMSIPIT